MRQTKKSIHNKRFLFITKKVQFRLRRAFKEWSYKAKQVSPYGELFKNQNFQVKLLFGGLKVANHLLMKRKNTMSLVSPGRNLRTAFAHWKTSSIFENESKLRDQSLQRVRGVQLNILASIMQKNVSLVKKISFWEMKRFSDEALKMP